MATLQTWFWRSIVWWSALLGEGKKSTYFPLGVGGDLKQGSSKVICEYFSTFYIPYHHQYCSLYNKHTQSHIYLWNYKWMSFLANLHLGRLGRMESSWGKGRYSSSFYVAAPIKATFEWVGGISMKTWVPRVYMKHLLQPIFLVRTILIASLKQYSLYSNPASFPIQFRLH